MAGKKKHRAAACGFHAVESLLSRSPQEILEVLADRRRRDHRLRRLQQTAEAAGIPCRLVERGELDRSARGVRHQGVVALLGRSHKSLGKGLFATIEAPGGAPLLLVLDRVQDPHNLGACLRSAEGAGVNAVVLPKDGACPVNATVRRVAAGAAERLPIFYVSNLARSLDALRHKGIWLIGGAEESDTILYDADLRGPLALVLGAEGNGLRRLTREHCDQLVRIPMAGDFTSLNVSVASGILLFEAVRQRLCE